MTAITEQIEAALNARLYFLAIFVAVAIPDICAALESQDGRTKPERYMNWYRRWLASALPYVHESQMYSLRCGIVHQGRAKHDGLTLNAVSATGSASHMPSPLSYSRVLFTIPTEPVTIVAEGGPVQFALNGETVYLQDAEIFCRTVISAALQWQAEKVDDPIVQANLVDLFRIRPEGYGLLPLPLIG